MATVFPVRNFLLAVAATGFLWLMGFTVLSASVISFFGFLRMGGMKFFLLLYRTLPRDLWYLRQIMKIGARTKDKNYYLSDHFQVTVKKYPNKVAVVFEDKKMTFKELDEASNKVANMLRSSSSLQRGDTVAVFMENCLEYIYINLALSKLGVIAAHINHIFRSDSLTNRIRAANCSGIFFTSALSEAVAEVLPDLSISDMLYSVGEDCSIHQAKSLEQEIKDQSSNNPPPLEMKSDSDIAAYLFTSGTTGLPKASGVAHKKFCIGPFFLSVFCKVVPEDVIYSPLPLYHITGGMLAQGLMFKLGSTLILTRKFSASNFWPDCIKHRCTIFFYSGQLCRYVLSQPKRPVDTQHSIRVMTGHGLSPEMWLEFTKRFHIAEVTEFYGSTGSNCGLINPFNKAGACGFFSVFLPFLNRARLIKLDPKTGEYVRDSQGFCVEAGVNEPGEIVGPIIKHDPSTHPHGYTDSKATQEKLMSDVFAHGDQVFLTGDIFRKDENGFLYFCDRRDDAFCWKGKIVFTREVEGVASKILQLRDVVVYGVEVPGNEGRAGMAAIVGSRESVDLSGLAQQLFLSLPHYAVPLFVRLIPSVDLTSTFKLKKVKLRNEGLDISLPDPLYILDTSSKSYVPLTEELYQKVQNEELKFEFDG